MFKRKTRMISAALVLSILVLTGSLTVVMAAPKEAGEIVEADAFAIDLGVTEVINDLTLPTSGQGGTKIIWQSDSPLYISETGEVKRPAKGNQKVILTAEITLQGVSKVRIFEMTVLENTESGNLRYLNHIKENYELAFATAYKDFTLPVETRGVLIDWKSADNRIQITNGNQAAITRAEYGEGTKEAIIIATFSIGSQSVNKKFIIRIPEMAWGYLLTYVVSEKALPESSVSNMDNCLTDSLHLALSDNGSKYTALNRGNAVLYASEKKQMGSPMIFRKADGTYGVVTSENESSSNIILYDSEDLIHYKNERVVSTNEDGITVMEPEVEFDIGIGAYRLRWKDENGQGYMVSTENFTTFSQPVKMGYTRKTAATGAVLPENAIETGILELTREEYERVENKYAALYNTGIAALEELKVPLDAEVKLPERVALLYNDGSEKEMPVNWNTEGIDFSIEGSYTVEGTVNQNIHEDPLIEECEDPYIVYDEEDKYYYLIRSVMATGESEDVSSRLNIRRAESVGELSKAEDVTILNGARTNEEGETHYRYFRAPQLYKIGGKWRIIVYEGADNNQTSEEVSIYTCDNGDIMNPESWTLNGAVSANDDGESLGERDVAYIESGDQCYYATLKNGSIYISDFDANNPLKPVGSLVKLGSPAMGWELNLDNDQEMSEDLMVIKHDGKVYIIYSGSTKDQPYYTGVLYADGGLDLCNPDNWTKIPYPLLTVSDGLKINSFFADSDGSINMIYHIEADEEMDNGSGANEPDRQVYSKPIHFAADGTPVFNMTAAEELTGENKTLMYKVTVANTFTVKYAAGTGGTVQGAVTQTIVKGGDTTEVTAQADAGYTFSEWSDGVTDATRADKNVTESRIVTAQFTRTAVVDSSPTEVTVSNQGITIGVNEKFTLRAYVLPEYASQSIEWTSSEESVAAVSATGEVVARKQGSAIITAKSSNGKSAVCEVIVLESPEEISVEPVEITLQNGNNIQLEIHLPEGTVSNRMIYSSSNESVAGISSKGRVTAKKRGKTTITVETFNGKKAEAEITVK